jgi:hypothetical protein
MRELNAGNCALRMDEARDARERLNLLVAPQAHICRGDAPLARNGSGFHHRQRDAADRAAPEMHQVPVIRHALDGAVLTHRRHDNAIAQSDAAQDQRAQEVSFWHLTVVVHA